MDISILTVPMQKYLEIIYDLSQSGGARVSDIAVAAGVSKSSVNSAMCVLSENGIVIYEKYQPIKLTEQGEHLASLLNSRHKILKEYFIKILNVDQHIADEDACNIEHIISPAIIEAMYDHLNEKL